MRCRRRRRYRCLAQAAVYVAFDDLRIETIEFITSCRDPNWVYVFRVVNMVNRPSIWIIRHLWFSFGGIVICHIDALMSEGDRRRVLRIIGQTDSISPVVYLSPYSTP